MSDKPTMIGTARWSGEYKGCPAIVLSYCDGAALWAYVDETGWKRTGTFSSVEKAIPRQCSECGALLPLEPGT